MSTLEVGKDGVIAIQVWYLLESVELTYTEVYNQKELDDLLEAIDNSDGDLLYDVKIIRR